MGYLCEQSQTMLHLLVNAQLEGRWVRTADLIEATGGQSHTRRLKDLRDNGHVIVSRKVRRDDPGYAVGAWEYQYVGFIPPDEAAAKMHEAKLLRLRRQLKKLSSSELERTLEGVI